MAKLVAIKSGSVGAIVFSNVDRMNAMTLQMWNDLPEAIERFDADPEIRVITLEGAGDKAFISGADISEFEKLRNSQVQQDEYENSVTLAMKSPLHCSKPVIAKIRGYCFGGGLGLAGACDIRICSDDATFRMPAARLGLGYGHEGIKRFVDIIGMANAIDIFVTARRFDAPDALRMGFVSKVCSTADLATLADQYAKYISDNAPLTVKASKYTILQVVEHPDNQDISGSVRMVEQCFASDDFKEGRRAFGDKRLPIFRGR